MLKTIATVDGFLNRLRDDWPLVFIPVCGLMSVAVALIIYALTVFLVPHHQWRPGTSISGLIFIASLYGLSLGAILWWKRRQGY
jgi:hypothetical protein